MGGGGRVDVTAELAPKEERLSDGLVSKGQYLILVMRGTFFLADMKKKKYNLSLFYDGAKRSDERKGGYWDR